MNWEPSEVDIEWTEAILETLEPGKSWVEGEMTFFCTEDKTLSLVSRTERAAEPAERVGIVLEMLGWTYITDDVAIVPDDPLEAMQVMQETAASWTCPHCDGEKMANLPLENAEWRNDGIHAAMTENGIEEFPRWTVVVNCPKCSPEVILSPIDYSLLVGEDAFYTWNIDGFTLKALSREDIIEIIDNDTGVVTSPIGTKWPPHSDRIVPPHMQGTFVSITRDEEE